MHRRVIIGIVLLCLSSPLFAQQGWQPFVVTIFGSQPVGGAFLNEQYGFVETASARIYRTTDGGITWTLIPNGRNYIDLINLQFYFFTPSTIYSGGAYESNDSGMSWHGLSWPAPSGDIYRKDNTIFDASGFISYDDCQTWIRPNVYNNGEMITGDLDKGIAMWGGSTGKVNGTLYSTDGGVTWGLGQAGIESDFGYAIPYSLTYFKAGGDGNDAIQRSLDGGKTWQTVYGTYPFRYFSDGLIGEGCVIYAQTMSPTHYPTGLIRSTDAGNSWLPIGGPIAADDIPICGIGARGSVLYAIRAFVGGKDTLFKYTDPTIARPYTSDLAVTRFFPDTITINQCDTIGLNLALGFSACDFIRMQNLQVIGLNPADYSTTFHKDRIIRTGQPDSASVHISALNAGTHKLLLHLSISGSDWSGADTLIPVTLIVKPVPPQCIVKNDAPIDFGTAVFCQAGGSDTLTISNPSCAALNVTNIRFEGDSLSQKDFQLAASSKFQLNRDSLPKSISIIFAPQSHGVKSGNLIIESDARIDTIPVHAVVLPDIRSLSVATDTVTAPLCDSSEGFITLTNPSCRRISLDSISIPTPYSLPGAALPIILDPGNSARLRFRFLASKRGFYSDNVIGHFRFFEPNAEQSFDSSITLSANCIHGTSDFILSSAAVIFDTLHLCDSAIKQVVLYSIGCDSLPLNTISLSGDNSFTISENGKRNIASGDSIVIGIVFDPSSVGSKTASINVTLSNGVTTIIPLSAVVAKPIRILSALQSGVMDFGTHLVCDPVDSLITLVNPSCDSVEVTGLSGLGLAFGTNTVFPFWIKSGGSAQIDLHTLIDTSGKKPVSSSKITIQSNADKAIAPLDLMHSYTYAKPVHLWLVSDKNLRTASDTFHVIIKADPVETADVTDVNFSLLYNSDLLGYIISASQNAISTTDSITFHISGNPKLAVSSDGSIAEIQFFVYVAKDTITSLAINNLLLNQFDPNFTGCTVTPLATGLDFNYLNYCGDRSIRSFMNAQPIVFSIRPNPAQDQIEIELHSPLKQDATIEIRNALGAKVLSDTKNVISGQNSIHLNTKNLPEGMYNLRITSDTGEASQSFVRVK